MPVVLASGENADSGPPRNKYKEVLDIYRPVFSGLLAVSIAAVIQLLQVVDCSATYSDNIARFLLSTGLFGEDLCLSGSFTLSLICFAVAIPGLAGNMVTLTANIRSDGPRNVPQFSFPFVGIIRTIQVVLHSRRQASRNRRDWKVRLRLVAVRTAQGAALVGIWLLFFQMSSFASILFLAVVVASYALTITYIVKRLYDA